MAGTEPNHMLAGIITFFLCECYALSVAVFGGSIADILEKLFYDQGFFSIEGAWGAESSWFAYHSCLNLLYISAYVLAGLGVVILILTIWHRHGNDTEDTDYQNQYNL